jgi:hypothetical protein
MVLDTDPALFLEKTIEDIDFIDHTLEGLLEYIQDNNRLFERDEALDYLSDLEWEFFQVLGEFSACSGSVSAAPYPVILEQIRLLRNRSTERRKIIDGTQSAVSAPVMENAVSSDELNELLKDF